jgi:hypothetical protein
MVTYVGYSLITLILFNMGTGIIPKLVSLIYGFSKTKWYEYKTG